MIRQRSALRALAVAWLMASCAPANRGDAEAGSGWRFPPTGPPTKRTPRLVNYCHISSELRRHPRETLERMLAQWDVVVLYPYGIAGEDPLVSPDRIRRLNPDVKLLAWVPLQGPSGSRWRRKVGERAIDLWSGRGTDGQVVVAPWGEPVMNPVADGQGWARHVVSFLGAECLGGPKPRYDGAMLDCLWHEPVWGIDVNQDGRQDSQDGKLWQEACAWMLSELRREHPDAILVGNGGAPMVPGSPYLGMLNGSMHENALGDQWGPPAWRQVWRGYRASVETARRRKREPMHLVVADVRRRRSREEARDLERLTEDDLRRMRLGLCTSLLLDGGYFGFDRGDCLHGQLWWFDEYGADIGKPTGAFERDALAGGLYSRPYESGIVVVNPSERSVVVDVGGPHFDHSSRTTASRHTIPPRDGRILGASLPR